MRWFRLLYPKLGKMQLGKTRLRGVPAIKLSHAYYDKLPSERHRSYLCELIVAKTQGKTFALSFHGPGEHRDIFKAGTSRASWRASSCTWKASTQSWRAR